MWGPIDHSTDGLGNHFWECRWLTEEGDMPIAQYWRAPWFYHQVYFDGEPIHTFAPELARIKVYALIGMRPWTRRTQISKTTACKIAEASRFVVEQVIGELQEREP